MKICVVGAGSIGGLLGVKLSLAGHEVTLIARGPNLAAIKAHGMKLMMHDGQEFIARDVRATDRIAEAGPQDIVILGMKAHQVTCCGRVGRAQLRLYGDPADAKRHSLVVFPAPRRPA